MLSYMNTMEQFLEVQGELLGSLVRPASGRRAALVDAPSRRFPLLGIDTGDGPRRVAHRPPHFRCSRRTSTSTSTRSGARSPRPIRRSGRCPVMPLTFSQEVAAEAAAALFPDRKVIAIVDTRAHRWIFLDRGTRHAAGRSPTGRKPRDTSAGCGWPSSRRTRGIRSSFPTMVEASVVLADRRARSAAVRALSTPAGTPPPAIGRAPRSTLGGRSTAPLFQGVRSISRRVRGGAGRNACRCFRGRGSSGASPHAELEIDPLLIRFARAGRLAVGLEGAVRGPRLPALRRGRPEVLRAGPVAAGDPARIEAPCPPSRAVERDRGSGGRGLRGERPGRPGGAGRSGVSHHAGPASHDAGAAESPFRRCAVRSISRCRGRGPPGSPSAPSRTSRIRVLEGSFGVWRKALAFLILSPPEREEWKGLKVPLRREIQWLLGRAAAKDALRHHFQESGGPRFASGGSHPRERPGGPPGAGRSVAGRAARSARRSPSATPMAWWSPSPPRLEDGAGLGVDAEKVRTPEPGSPGRGLLRGRAGPPSPGHRSVAMPGGRSGSSGSGAPRRRWGRRWGPGCHWTRGSSPCPGRRPAGRGGRAPAGRRRGGGRDLPAATSTCSLRRVTTAR